MSDAHEVGPLGEEAVKLLGVLSGWARDHVGEAGEGLSGLAGQAASAVHDLDEHFATGASECTVCPVCRAVHAFRQLSPEVTTHLSAAVTSLAQAAAAIVATPARRPDGHADVEQIDLDDADGDWPKGD